MGLLDAKAAAAGKTQGCRKPVDSVSVAPMRRGKPQADRGAVVQAKVRDRAQIWTRTPGSEIGLEVLGAVALWPQDLREAWGERAAIMEYDGGLPRPAAERRAYEIVRTAHEAALLMAKAKQ